MNANAVPNPPPSETPCEAPAPAGGGEPPYCADIDRRLTVLETRFDTILPTLLTKDEFHVGMAELRTEMRADMEKMRDNMEKMRYNMETMRADIEKMRAEMHKLYIDAMKWVMGISMTLILSIVGTGVALSNVLRSMAIHVAAVNPAPPVPAITTPQAIPQAPAPR